MATPDVPLSRNVVRFELACVTCALTKALSVADNKSMKKELFPRPEGLNGNESSFMNSSVYQQVSSTPAESDRRHDLRFPVHAQIELHEEGSDVPIRGETADLSRGGCYMELTLTLVLGANLNGRLWLGESVVRFRGRVVTCHPQFGNGIMFLELDGDGAHVLANYLEKLDF
jgi:hypothetical protein